jgi:hypothetical protein
MNKLEINCATGIKEELPFTPEEIANYLLEQQYAEEQALLDALTPPQSEIEQAEFELKAITLLTEVGLL